MNIAELAIKYKIVTAAFTILFAVAGIGAYQQLSRLEDPEFTIKEAVVYARYPGASPKEVEEEVTDPLETAIQQLGQIKNIRSRSEFGFSQINVEIKDNYDKDTLPQVWTELRNKVNDAQGQLPPNTTTLVYDDFGDVYGLYFAVTGPDFTDAELKDYVDFLKRELLLVQDVAKISLYGTQQEVVYIEISNAKLTQLGLPLSSIYNLLEKQNLLEPAGKVEVGNEYIRIAPTGGFPNVEAIGNLLISDASNQPSSSSADKTTPIIRLRDVANIYRGYEEPYNNKLYFDNKPAIGVGISTVSGGNVVTMGQAVEKRIEELEPFRPIGIEFGEISIQARSVNAAVQGFIVNLAEAVLIVVGVLLLTMGLRSGIIIGFILVLIVLATFVLMNLYGIALQRISLGALIIALGMLVDNAIVIVEGCIINQKKNLSILDSLKQIVGQTTFPLLGATVIAILAFSGIGLSDDSTGEFAGSLFWVILFSLFLSWIFAITTTPLICYYFLRIKPDKDNKDPYDNFFLNTYKRFLAFVLNNRLSATLILIATLTLSVWGMQFIPQSFFPDSTRPQFYLDYWLPQGTHIQTTEADLKQITDHVLTLPTVVNTSTFIGKGGLRFILTFSPEDANTAYGQVLVTVNEYDDIAKTIPLIKNYINQNYPEAQPIFNRFVLGPGGDAKIQARFSGPDPTILRQLSRQTQDIFYANNNATNIRDDWRQPVKVIHPQISEQRTIAAGLTQQEISQAIQTQFSGLEVGTYRDGNKLLPIISRRPPEEGSDAEQIQNTQVYSSAANATIPLQQLATAFTTDWEDPIIRRRDRRLTIIPQCDSAQGPASTLLSQVKPLVESIPLPPGYMLEWGGEFEDSADAQAQLFAPIPTIAAIMFLTLICIFNALRTPLIIFLTVPFAIVGVSIGLVSTQQPFNFMALIGFLSLSGMLIKNAIVLIDQINLERAQGLPPYQAVVQASVSRVRPVTLAAVTTILGMIPLLADVFFAAMAVTIMAGLAFATLLTLIVVPLLYTLFFRIKPSHTKQ
ncbi:Nickel and cobalt resistance protein CnrA [Poriferisphaera corsica]|uniref:Nickel and cobalt resistance protein CnrA n=1 Tax=Poriferisphaera corsica TaxID=2528020 RepID=A0A517YQZ6_9BACT|nr:efflux RND transporter permease subunit [Poriferisphaera corsica]QDU32645.1 Nickel and cobalt resistance protein CnrA [Poriferisphaera corsica]